MMGVLTGVLGSILPWSAASSRLLVDPAGGALLVLVAATVSGVSILIRPWAPVDRVPLPIAGGAVLGAVGRTAIDLRTDGTPALEIGLPISTLAGLALLVGEAVDFLVPPE